MDHHRRLTQVRPHGGHSRRQLLGRRHVAHIGLGAVDAGREFVYPRFLARQHRYPVAAGGEAAGDGGAGAGAGAGEQANTLVVSHGQVSYPMKVMYGNSAAANAMTWLNTGAPSSASATRANSAHTP